MKKCSYSHLAAKRKLTEEVQLTEKVTQASQLYKKGLREFHRGQFTLAEQNFRDASDHYRSREEWNRYLETAGYLVRAHVERDIDTFSSANGQTCELYGQFRKSIVDLLETVSLDNRAKSLAYFVLGLIELAEGKIDQSRVCFLASLELAENGRECSARVGPLYALAFCAESQGDYETALKYLDKLGLLLQTIEQTEYFVKYWHLRALIFYHLGDYDNGLKAAWQSYRTLFQVPNFLVYVHTLVLLARLYQGKRDKGGARHYLELAQQALVGSELRRVSADVNDALKSLLEEPVSEEFDFRYEIERGMLISRHGRAIDFGGQYVLQNLLALFASAPMRSFTKEEIIRAVWNESYNPEVHNNKIYVTIRRLRRMLQQMEIHVPNSQLIIRAQDGYRLDPQVHIQLL